MINVAAEKVVPFSELQEHMVGGVLGTVECVHCVGDRVEVIVESSVERVDGIDCVGVDSVD